MTLRSHRLAPVLPGPAAYWPALVLLLLLFLTRLMGLDVFPFHVDEGIHTRWAIEVWGGHPFWNISDAKIISHWPIAAFYPQNAPTFVARYPTVLISLLGLAAGYALVRRLFGLPSAVIAGVLWIVSPYLFFYERLALMDAEIGDLGVLALWSSVVLARHGTVRSAVLAGVSLALAILFKLTAVVFVPMVALVPLVSARYSWARRFRLALVAGVACAACFLVPLAYMLLKAENFFDVPRQFVSTTGGGAGGSLVEQFIANLDKLWLQLVGFDQWLWLVAFLLGLILLMILGGRWGRLLLLAAGISLAIILLLGKTVFPRYYVAVLPAGLILGGAGLGLAVDRIGMGRLRWLLLSASALVLVLAGLPFMVAAYTTPASLPLSDAMREQYYNGPSAGFGLREAAQSLPEGLAHPDLLVIASMRPDSCLQANYYATEGFFLTCADAPGTDAINAALASDGAVYVLTDHAPLIGIDVSTLDAAPTLVAAFPRPGETDDTATIVLWLLEAPLLPKCRIIPSTSSNHARRVQEYTLSDDFCFWNLAAGIAKLPIFPLKNETNVYTNVYPLYKHLCYTVSVAGMLRGSAVSHMTAFYRNSLSASLPSYPGQKRIRMPYATAGFRQRRGFPGNYPPRPASTRLYRKGSAIWFTPSPVHICPIRTGDFKMESAKMVKRAKWELLPFRLCRLCRPFRPLSFHFVLCTLHFALFFHSGLF